MRRLLSPLLGLLVTIAPSAAYAQQSARTTSAISAADLRQRLFAFAHDSMEGREPGHIGDFKAAEYVASELQRLGLQPAGENGGWFQVVPFWSLRADTSASLAIGGEPLRLGLDIVPFPRPATSRSVDGASVVFGGTVGAATPWAGGESAQGRIVVLDTPPSNGDRAASPLRLVGELGRSPRLAGAALICVVGTEQLGSSTVAAILAGRLVQDTVRDSGLTPVAIISRAAAERMLGVRLTEAHEGMVGQTVHGRVAVGFYPLAYPARNVVAILPGSDPALRSQYVSVTAHNDHVGFDRIPVDHDSLRAFDRVIRPMGADTPPHEPSDQERVRIRQILDSLRALRPPRADSIRNGADDDGTGTVALLEIAEQMVRERHPRRSMLFVSHTAEEFGLLGSKWYTDHATVPVDSIVGEIDMDMIGRGSTTDLPEAGPAYLEVVGLRRLSTEYGDVIDAVNARQPQPFRFNLTYDQPGHPLQYYCRADHYNYARYGIPSIAVSRGEHLDYHQVTDEAQYIDYDALARVAVFVHDAALALANLDHRPRLDAPKGDPHAQCRQ